MSVKKDNSTIKRKLQLRFNALEEIKEPVVMETHGGFGRVWEKCYSSIARGIVFETDKVKSGILAKQRPSWSVYESDCEQAIRAGAGNHLAVNFIDVDPYGDPWPIINAFFDSERIFPEKIVIVVNDGLRMLAKRNGSWNCDTLEKAVLKYGNNNVFKNYKEICADFMKDAAAKRKYSISRWTSYYCGNANNMTHYAAVLCR